VLEREDPDTFLEALGVDVVDERLTNGNADPLGVPRDLPTALDFIEASNHKDRLALSAPLRRPLLPRRRCCDHTAYVSFWARINFRADLGKAHTHTERERERERPWAIENDPPLCTCICPYPLFEATPPGAAPGPPVKTGALGRRFWGCNKTDAGIPVIIWAKWT